MLSLVVASGCGDPQTPPPPAHAPVAAAGPVDAGSAVVLAQLEGVAGDVRLSRAGSTGPVVAGTLYAGDAVETGADGKATVRFADGHTVDVGSEARFALGSDSQGIVLTVARGVVLSRVPASAGTSVGSGSGSAAPTRVALSILTPFGLTRVGSEPSEVSVRVAEDAAHVEVKLGAIEFVSKDGQTLRADAGESVEVASGRAQVVGRAARVVELAPISVTLRTASGRAEVKSKGSARWRWVRKDGEELAAGDGVRVRSGTAVLTLRDSASLLSLTSGSEAVLEGAGQGGTSDETRLDLRKGSLGLQLAAGRSSRVVLPTLSLEGAGAARLAVQRTASGLLVEAQAGDVTLVRGEARQPLRAGERATVESSGTAAPRVELLERAAMELAPGDNGEVFHKGLGQVALTWEGAGDAVVDVAQDSAFTRPILTGLVHQPFVNVAAPARGALYWRVRKPDGTQVSAGSVRFAPEEAPKELARLRNVVPEGPEKTTIFYQDKPPAVTFTYGAEARATSYRVAVYLVGELSSPVAERTVSDTHAALDAGALREGSYLWSVTPLSSAGAALQGGRMNKLELIYDNSVQELVIESPRNGQPAAAKIRATGVAPVDSHLSINGRPVTLDGKHRFDIWSVPVGTPPMLVFKMSRPGAPAVQTVRTLKQRGP
ncbi:FecR family protein [Corallococcus sp. M34]|uniref:FecR domain-containing protein n=1 Tax=Citreicoccus inhibens TaxID=2849499 RepID=UPI001C213CC4|nr:FecR domain-containing protein [Citreicoccus inhibens]MBU8899543.1 FecR family protein [Citreicoccus inhibens]